MNEPTIHVEGLSKRYGDTRAAEDISFDVYPGEIFAILGPNGAGKTTTVRMMLGLIQPDSGHARLFGQPVSDKLYPRIGYLPEERGLYQDISVLDCLGYLIALKGVPRSEARKCASTGLERMELEQVAKSKVKTLSKGMQQKVQFLAATLHEPELLVIDEPFSGLDPVNARLIEAMIFDMAARGVTVVMNTHEMARIEQMADRLMMISRGKRVLYGDVGDVRQTYATGAVHVRATGDIAHLPGVASLSQEEDGTLEIQPKPGVTPNELLSQLVHAPDIQISAFEIALPSLDDIFVQVVKEQS